MRKPDTIREYIRKTEEKMYLRTKSRRVSAGALNRDIARMSIHLSILRAELRRSLAIWVECEQCMGSGSSDCDRSCGYCYGRGRIDIYTEDGK